ncbi:MAG: hypothetical protein J5523_08675 [Muribaculaceae bacterium]|nr:hypothetical protein [Muribaculaceae bacterium]
MKINQNSKYLFLLVIQLSLLVYAYWSCLYYQDEFMFFFRDIPILIISSLIFIFLIKNLAKNKLHKLLSATKIINGVFLGLFFLGFILGGRRGYNEYMTKRVCDTIPYTMTPTYVKADDGAIIFLSQSYVTHIRDFQRKHLFSSQFELKKKLDLYDWHDFYRLTINQKHVKNSTAWPQPDLSSASIRLLNTSKDCVLFMGHKSQYVQFDFVYGNVPKDTLKVEVKHRRTANDTIILIKQLNN